jgi:D-3-phosphoglycerate dehydrogenase
LEGDILLYQNPDVPGMLAAVAGTLAKQNINIGALGLGRTAKGENAITAVIIDKKMDKNDIIPISELDGVKAVKYISLTE